MVTEKILRFHRSERLMHWALAVPFMVCFSTALILVFVYNPDPSRPYRAAFSWTHRLSGVAFIVLPLLAALRCRGDVRLHLYNIAQAWRWTFNDIRWLALVGLAGISSRVQLPEQGKFNAGEKINFMMILTTYPLYIVTGLLVWLPGIAFFSWMLHVLMAFVATPLLVGHLYMAVVNPGSRKGLEGMVTGFVDRKWAKHHYRQWYREEYERNAPSTKSSYIQGSARIRCNGCQDERVPDSWCRVLEQTRAAAAVACPACGADGQLIIVDPQPWMLAFVRPPVGTVPLSPVDGEAARTR